MSKKVKSPEIQIEEEIKDIRVLGAREHNLKNINLTIPRDKFIVFTGLSGSGKSSLAFDTLYAEGQRRYIECLSSYAKNFIGGLKKPDVDLVEGLSPSISIEQKTLGSNPRSTVGTVTEIYDYLRLLYAKIGVQYCTTCNIPVEKKTLDQIIENIYEDYAGQRALILAPIVKGRKGHYRELFEQLIKQGYSKVRIDGLVKELIPGMQLPRFQIHNIELVIDKIIINEDSRPRIRESSALALDKGEGTMTLFLEKVGSREDFWTPVLYSSNYSCPSCHKAYDMLAPNNFSFNSPFGACKECNGIGEVYDFEYDLLVKDDNLSIAENGILFVENSKANWLYTQIENLMKLFQIDIKTPIAKIPKKVWDIIMYGLKEEELSIGYKLDNGTELKFKHKYIGVIPTLNHLHKSSTTAGRNKYEEAMVSKVCHECNGGRLNKQSLNVFIDGNHISNLTQLNIDVAYGYFKELNKKLSKRDQTIATLVLKEIYDRLEFLENVGLGYLSLNRTARTLSGGESQRIRLASQIGSKLVGVMYVLDEPSIGLHQHDNDKLINSLKNLRDLGNTLIVVEHDKAMIEGCDLFIDMGPGAGIHGGEIILMADPNKLKSLKQSEIESSLTARYLLGEKQEEFVSKERKGSGKTLSLYACTGNNLKCVDLHIPLGKLTVVTGLSGSGKSSLINDTLYPILSKFFFRGQTNALPYESIDGLEHIDKVIEIDQSPIGRTPRSNPSTYTGMFTLIRDYFAMLPEAKIRGYKTGRFSFNVKGGRCEECEGAGMKKIEMNFLPDVFVNCEICDGKRYNQETLTVLYKGKSIADVLDMTVEEALEFFRDIPSLYQKIKTLNDVGLGYITLGQQSPTLSGGEAQRVKLATELSKRSTGKTLYLLDEPTTGLHFEDIRLLNKIMQELVDKGNTVLVIEHNLDIIKAADWIIDLGPLGGSGGGEIIAEGTPTEVAKVKKSITGYYLKEELKIQKSVVA